MDQLAASSAGVAGAVGAPAPAGTPERVDAAAAAPRGPAVRVELKVAASGLVTLHLHVQFEDAEPPPSAGPQAGPSAGPGRALSAKAALADAQQTAAVGAEWGQDVVRLRRQTGSHRMAAAGARGTQREAPQMKAPRSPELKSIILKP